MKDLFDTHTFIWRQSNPGKLSTRALALCEDKTNILLLSLASVWEMQIKVQLGKITLHMPLPEIIESQQQTNQVEVLPIVLAHIFALGTLPDHHKDPFDRLLIAQAMAEDVSIISHDAAMAQYPVTIVW